MGGSSQAMQDEIYLVESLSLKRTIYMQTLIQSNVLILIGIASILKDIMNGLHGR